MLYKDKNYIHCLLVFISVLVASNLGAGKICILYGLQIDAGTALFPFLYIISDLVAEIYGYYACRAMVSLALLVNLFISSFLALTIRFPCDVSIAQNIHYHAVYTLSPSIFFGSTLAYFVGELLNIYVITFMKEVLKGRYFVLRAIISTFIGSLVESIIFTTIAFYSILTLYEIYVMSISLALIKVSYEILLMPLILPILPKLKSTRVFS